MRRTKRSTAGNRYNAVILEEQTRAELGATLSEELQEELGVFAVVEDPDDKEFKVSKTGKEIIDENSAGCSKNLGNNENSESDDHSSEYSTDSSDITESESSDEENSLNSKSKATTRNKRRKRKKDAMLKGL